MADIISLSKGRFFQEPGPTFQGPVKAKELEQEILTGYLGKSRENDKSLDQLRERSLPKAGGSMPLVYVPV